MAKVTFSSLKKKNEENIKKFTFNDKEIEVLQYLPVNEKNNLLIFFNVVYTDTNYVEAMAWRDY